jgi:hypothetical protein
MPHSRARHRRVAATAALSAVAALALSTAAFAAPIGLPPGAQVNDDPVNNIDPHQPAGVSDVVGGSLVAGGVNVPWATFEQKTPSVTSPDSQQIFVRAFKGGAWKTQGFPASLNIDTRQEAEAPSIDFAGAGRTVPWVSWYEPNVHLGGGTATNIFASRFDSAGNVWIPEGQDRAPANRVPSLNIHTDRNAENPAVAGGATVAGNAPVPWVAWQEEDGGDGSVQHPLHEQIFVSKGIKQANCAANLPGGGTSVSQFCWQQVGLKRINADSGAPSATGDTTLNVDPTRDGIEPDDAFTGANDTVPWIVWYEKGDSKLGGFAGNEQVFAAKGVADANADGGFHWVAVGNGTAGQTNVLDTNGTTHWGSCLSTPAAENACSLNLVPGHDAEDPRVATGTLTPGGTTVPWVAWSEDTGTGTHAIFVSRLVNGDHFELANNGQPISNTVNDSSRPDITFSGNTPYVTWQENVGGDQRTFTGHFEGLTSFKLDTPAGLDGTTVADLRSPVSSGCTSNPFTADGQACPGGAAGTPFSLRTLTNGQLLATAYNVGEVQTGAASAITSSSAHVAATVDPAGAAVHAHIEFGRTTGYELGRTADGKLGPAAGATAFAADLAGLPAGTVIHYRAVASTDFGSAAGPDRTFVTATVAGGGPGGGGVGGHVLSIGGGTLHLSRHRTIAVKLICSNAVAKCSGTLRLTSGGHLLGSARFSITRGHSSRVLVHLSRKSAAKVRRAHRLKVRISAAGVSRTATLKA